MSTKSKAVVGHISEMPAEPGITPGAITAQDEARATALRIHTEHSLPFLERIIKDTKKTPRVRMDAVKLVQQQALPPPQPVLGDVQITIIVDM